MPDVQSQSADPNSDLVARLRRRDRRSLARLISLVENKSADVLASLGSLGLSQGSGYVVGVTGPPGAGKSTLVDQLIRVHRRKGDEVAVVAVDPTSPFSGGAVLGDRIRMHEHALDPGVYIRSMGTRGNQGGLAAATGDVIRLLQAYGFPRILIETVGVGQTEIEIMEHADTTIVVLVPESGDSVQIMKAGVLESADIFVVNKADRPGASQLASELRGLSHFRRHGLCEVDRLDWEIPVLETEAANGKGVEALIEHIERHRNVLETSGALAQRRMARRRAEFKKRLLAEFHQQLDAVLVSNAFDALVARVDNGGLEPEAAMTALREQMRSRL